jgi:hypothetical protein
MEQLVYSEDNVKLLVDKIQAGKQYELYLEYYYKKVKEELCVHTQGKLFDKVIKVFKNEEPESSRFVLDTYESVTKGSIWRGIDNLSRIFNNTGFDLTGDQETINSLSDSEFFTQYINDFINISTAIDPNAIQAWIKKDDKWVSKFVRTEFIKLINDKEIAFILEEESDYTLRVKSTRLGGISNYEPESQIVRNSYFEGVEYVWGEKMTYIYINGSQYLKIVTYKNNASVEIENFDTALLSPYSYTGVERIEKGVYHSAVAGFIPFGNHALIQHRTYRSVEAIFGYPRMSEVELPCENCIRGLESCDPCEEFPEGQKPCRTCHGSGFISLQSPFKIYKRKLFPDSPELNANIKPVEFFTPDIQILTYNAEAWKKTLELGEDAIYIQQRVETGNVESAKSREKQLESMYSWLGRISSVIYQNLQNTLDNYSLITGSGKVSVNKPISFAIMNELEAFEYLNAIVSSDAPVFIKTSHIENFLNKYISRTSPVIKIVEVLKRVDPFVFYSNKDLQTLSDSGVIDDSDWRVHSYAFPLLMQLYTREPELFASDYDVIEARLMAELDKKSRNDMFEQKPITNSEDNEDDERQEPEMISGVIEILLSIDDIANRRKVLNQQIKNWDREGISYKIDEILESAELN